MEHHTSTPQTTKKDDLSIPIAIVFSGLLIAGAIIYTDKVSSARNVAVAAPSVQAQEEQDPTIPSDVLAIKADDHIIGDPNAPIVLVEYSDVQCPYCQRFHDTMTAVVKAYPGQVAWVYRHFPLDSIHPYARKGGEALECAAEQDGAAGFERMMNAIFSPNAGDLAPESLPALAARVGLDESAFATCLSSGKYADRVNRDFEEGAGIGVRGTPFSVAWNRSTNAQRVVNGAQAFPAVSAVITALGGKQVQQ